MLVNYIQMHILNIDKSLIKGAINYIMPLKVTFKILQNLTVLFLSCNFRFKADFPRLLSKSRQVDLHKMYDSNFLLNISCQPNFGAIASRLNRHFLQVTTLLSAIYCMTNEMAEWTGFTVAQCYRSRSL